MGGPGERQLEDRMDRKANRDLNALLQLHPRVVVALPVTGAPGGPAHAGATRVRRNPSGPRRVASLLGLWQSLLRSR